MRGTWRRRLGAYLLALCLCLSLLPAAALAVGDAVGGEGDPFVPPVTEIVPGKDPIEPDEPVEPPKPQEAVPYIEYTWENNTLKGEEKSISTYTEISPTSAPTTWGEAGQETWYVASGSVTIGTEAEPQRVTVSGTVNLILKDGRTLTVHGGIQVAEGSTLTIYGQAANAGQLIATAAAGSGDAGIGGNSGQSCGAITIHGGRVTATGGAGGANVEDGGTGGGAAIGSGAGGDMSSSASITISGKADVTATAGGDGAAIGTGADGNMSSKASITIGDWAIVNATAGGDGAAIGTGAGGTMQGNSGGQNASSITIQEEATVTATANGTGAAIGTGQGTSSVGGVITIRSENPSVCPTVIAEAKDGGAAIGSGAGAELRTEIRIIGPAVVDATARGGGAAIGSGRDGGMAGYGSIKIDNGDDTAKQDTEFSPEIEATVSGGAAAVIGCGENGSIKSISSDITIGGTAVITLWENNPTRSGWVSGAAIGVGGYPEGGTETSIPDDLQSKVINIRNTLSSSSAGDGVETMADITIHGEGWIGAHGYGYSKANRHPNVSIYDSVVLEVIPYPTTSEEPEEPQVPEEPQKPEEPGGGSSSGGDSEPTYPPEREIGAGGSATVSPRTPEEGDTVTLTPEPEAGYEVDEITVTDRNGNAVEVTENGDGTWTFEQPRGRVTISVTFRPTGTASRPLPFTDVPEDYWAYGAIRYVYENGLMAGTSETTFSPGDTLSRQQVWMILARLDGYTPEDMEAARGWAVSAGISDGSNPGDPVTRQQLAALLYRFLQRNGGGFTGAWAFPLDYPDAGQVSAYAYEALCWMTMRGVITGMADGTLNPHGTATRAQFAVMLMRFCELDK